MEKKIVDSNANVENDEKLLLISGSKGDKFKDKEYVKKLSNAILQVFAKHDMARMRCVGAASLNNAIKAFIIAKDDSYKRGINIVLDPSFTTVSMQGMDRTGIILEVIENNNL